MANCFRSLLAGTLCFFIGCGGSGPAGAVSGKLSKGGQPLSGVTVSFMGNTGAGSGVTDSSGVYKLSSPLPVGKYRVALTKSSGAAIEASSADYEKMMSGGATPPAEKADSTIDAKYQSVSTSKLEFDVKEGENPIDITIE